MSPEPDLGLYLHKETVGQKDYEGLEKLADKMWRGESEGVAIGNTDRLGNLLKTVIPENSKGVLRVLKSLDIPPAIQWTGYTSDGRSAIFLAGDSGKGPATLANAQASLLIERWRVTNGLLPSYGTLLLDKVRVVSSCSQRLGGRLVAADYLRTISQKGTSWLGLESLGVAVSEEDFYKLIDRSRSGFSYLTTKLNHLGRLSDSTYSYPCLASREMIETGRLSNSRLALLVESGRINLWFKDRLRICEILRGNVGLKLPFSGKPGAGKEAVITVPAII